MTRSRRLSSKLVTVPSVSHGRLSTDRFCTVIKLIFPPRLVFFTQALESDGGFGAVEGTVVGVEVWETSPSSISMSSTAAEPVPADIIGADVEDEGVEDPDARLPCLKSTE